MSAKWEATHYELRCDPYIVRVFRANDGSWVTMPELVDPDGKATEIDSQEFATSEAARDAGERWLRDQLTRMMAVLS